MPLRITCPQHVGITSASLPRVLKCHRCGHDALIKSGKQVISQDEQPSEMLQVQPSTA